MFKFHNTNKLRLAQGVFEYTKKKKEGLIAIQNDVETLAIGNSHCDSSIVPCLLDGVSYNLGLASLDMLGTYNLYKKFSKLPKLKNILCVVSIFSPGYELTKTKSHWRSKAEMYAYVFNFNYDNLCINERKLKKICF